MNSSDTVQEGYQAWQVARTHALKAAQDLITWRSPKAWADLEAALLVERGARIAFAEVVYNHARENCYHPDL